MSRGYFGKLAPELLAQICSYAELEDIVALQGAHEYLYDCIAADYFTRFTTAKINWMESASIITLSGPKIGEREISSNARTWRAVVKQTTRIQNLELVKTDAAYKTDVLDLVARCWDIATLDVTLKESNKEVSLEKTSKNYQENNLSLQSLTLHTKATTTITLERRGTGAYVYYKHPRNTNLHQRLISPMFQAMLAAGDKIDSLEIVLAAAGELEYALQCSFQVWRPNWVFILQAALPFCQRHGVRKLRLDFGKQLASMTHAEVNRVLTTFAPTLYMTPNIQLIVLNLKEVEIQPGSFENALMAISRELRGPHRISVQTKPPVIPEPLPIVPNLRLHAVFV